MSLYFLEFSIIPKLTISVNANVRATCLWDVTDYRDPVESLENKVRPVKREMTVTRLVFEFKFVA